MIRAVKTRGFTLIELTLAMAFISVLLLAIVSISIQAGKMYSKGVILKSTSQAGQDVGGLLRRDVLQTSIANIAQDADNSAVIEFRQAGEVMSRRVCLDGASYIWNEPDVVRGARGEHSNLVARSADGKPLNFVRVYDVGASWCEQDMHGNYQMVLRNEDSYTSLLKQSSGDNEVVLSLYDLSLSKIMTSEGGSEGLVRISYTIGTGERSELQEVDGYLSCKPPGVNGANSDFCAINQFDMIARTNG